MKEKIEQIRQQALAAIEDAAGIDKLNDVKVAFLGKKGQLSSLLKGMKDVAPEDRPKVGQMVNEARAGIEAKMEEKRTAIQKKLREEKMKKEVIDVTLPGKKVAVGHRHPNQIALDDLERVFIGMGYEVVEGPEVEYDHYNFELLNIPPGRVFRSDEVDATHSPSFHQVEGLVVDKGITFADLKGTLQQWAEEFFGPDTKVKFRPHHFPFTEPSAEVDVSCFKCGGKGCRMCKGSGWIEILGCGMVHPKVLSDCGIDPEVYPGFAFGIGLERVTLLKYEIDDMRLLYENDARFLKQF